MTLKITKTPKCHVGGAFIRSESGRVTPLHDHSGGFVCNIPLCSKKDLRNAVEAAAKGGAGWAKRTPYNRAQILYRLAEMLESRATEMTECLDLVQPANTSGNGRNAREVRSAIDRVVYFAGWADKYEQVLGSVNPVATSHFNFTVTEPLGVVGILAPDESPLLALLTMILPAVTCGNSVVALASHANPLAAILLGEMLATSDLPGGVVNLLTGNRDELLPTFASHEQIRAIHAAVAETQATALRRAAADSVKHVIISPPDTDWLSPRHESVWPIRDLTEAKTIWHPIGS